MNTRYYPLSLGGQEYKVVYTLDALILIEELTGETLQQLLEACKDEAGKFDANRFIKAKNIKFFLYAGLRDQHPTLTQLQVSEMVTFAEYPAVARLVIQAFFGSFGNGDEPGKTQMEEAANGTGDQSSDLEQPAESNPGSSDDIPSEN